LLTRPVSRKVVLLSKWLAIETRLFIMTVVLCSVTLVSFAAFSQNAPLSYFENDYDTEKIIAAIEKSPENISEVWELDGDFFSGWMMNMISSTMASDAQVIEELDVDEADLAAVISRIEDDPNALFNDLLNDPEEYMAMFNIPESERETFKGAVEERRVEFESIKQRYTSDPSFHLEMLETSPEYFFKDIKTRSEKDKLLQLYPDSAREVTHVVSAYSTVRIIMLHTYIFMFMTVISSLSMLISVSLKQSKNAVSIGTGVILTLYFISTLMKISPVTARYTWISPFGLIDQSITGATYVFNPVNVSMLIMETVLILIASLIVFEKRDI